MVRMLPADDRKLLHSARAIQAAAIVWISEAFLELEVCFRLLVVTKSMNQGKRGIFESSSLYTNNCKYGGSTKILMLVRVNQKKYMFETLQSCGIWQSGSQDDSCLESCSHLLLIFFHAFVAGILLYLIGLQRILKGTTLTPLPNFPRVLFGKAQ